jgi:hypothetical protein
MLIYAVDALVQPCWGSPRPDGGLYVNPLALSEPIFLFAKMTELIYKQATQKPTEIIYQVSFRRLMSEGGYAKLAEGRLDKYFFGNGNSHSASQSDLDRTVTWSRGDVDPGMVAYQLVQEIYHWFGIEDPGIPYTVEGPNGDTFIDSAALLEAGK